MLVPSIRIPPTTKKGSKRGGPEELPGQLPTGVGVRPAGDFLVFLRVASAFERQYGGRLLGGAPDDEYPAPPSGPPSEPKVEEDEDDEADAGLIGRRGGDVQPDANGAAAAPAEEVGLRRPARGQVERRNTRPPPEAAPPADPWWLLLPGPWTFLTPIAPAGDRGEGRDGHIPMEQDETDPQQDVEQNNGIFDLLPAGILIRYVLLPSSLVFLQGYGLGANSAVAPELGRFLSSPKTTGGPQMPPLEAAHYQGLLLSGSPIGQVVAAAFSFLLLSGVSAAAAPPSFPSSGASGAEDVAENSELNIDAATTVRAASLIRASALFHLLGNLLIWKSSGIAGLFVGGTTTAVYSVQLHVAFLGRLAVGISEGLQIMSVPRFLRECLPADKSNTATNILEMHIASGMISGAVLGLFVEQEFVPPLLTLFPTSSSVNARPADDSWSRITTIWTALALPISAGLSLAWSPLLDVLPRTAAELVTLGRHEEAAELVRATTGDVARSATTTSGVRPEEVVYGGNGGLNPMNANALTALPEPREDRPLEDAPRQTAADLDLGQREPTAEVSSSWLARLNAEYFGDATTKKAILLSSTVMLTQAFCGHFAILTYAQEFLTCGSTSSKEVLGQTSGGPNPAFLSLTVFTFKILATIHAQQFFDLFSRRKILLTGLSGMGLFYALSGLSHQFRSQFFAAATLLSAVLSYQYSLGPLSFTYVSELFSESYQFKGAALMTTVNSFANAGINYLVPQVLHLSAVGGATTASAAGSGAGELVKTVLGDDMKSLVLLLFSVNSAIGYWFVEKFLPETHNLTLQQVQELLRRPGFGFIEFESDEEVIAGEATSSGAGRAGTQQQYRRHHEPPRGVVELVEREGDTANGEPDGDEGGQGGSSPQHTGGLDL